MFQSLRKPIQVCALPGCIFAWPNKRVIRRSLPRFRCAMNFSIVVGEIAAKTVHSVAFALRRESELRCVVGRGREVTSLVISGFQTQSAIFDARYLMPQTSDCVRVEGRGR